MSYTKSSDELEQLKKGGQIIGEILESISKLAKPGISTIQIDEEAEKMIIDAGGKPAFKNYKPHGMRVPFPGTICACINEEIVHGIPSENKILKNGDLFTIDIGMIYGGMYTDTAFTVPVGEVSREAYELNRVTQEALEMGIKECVAGNTVADIGNAIETYIKSQGKYGIVRDLCGHGVGHAVHEEPYVFNFYDRSSENWELKPGVVLALEPMVTTGSWQVETMPDEWTIVSRDRSLSSHFEHTVIITDGEPIVATRRPNE